ncbi:MAG: Uma2 family endonuclease [Pyrinomonadaceae bacterium MAG19_C2-C3]|nr:Uma2 family endonuclease [Pyrinomonadaceae bacterium MAG19_C2-C3]
MSTLIEPVVTVEDLAAMPDDGNRYEVIEGEIFVSGAPNFIHQVATSNLIGSIHPYLRKNPIGTIVPTPGLILSPIDGVIPDVVYYEQ